jgi:hypothetical protein
MGHIQEFEAALRARLAEGDEEAIVKWAKEQVLQSYRNGLAAPKRPAVNNEAGPEIKTPTDWRKLTRQTVHAMQKGDELPSEAAASGRRFTRRS